MAPKIGVLGESTFTSVSTVTLYTVPSDKAARVRVQFVTEGGAGAYAYCLLIGSPGNEFTMALHPSSGNDVFSGVASIATPDPALSLLGVQIGKQEGNTFLDLEDPGGTANDWFVCPLPADYYLNDGDTVRCRVDTTALVDHVIQVVGVEDDA